jgi:hypothetical protein
MTRTADRPVPTIGGGRPAAEPWPAHLYIGIARLPVVNYVYDDYTAAYDSPSGAFTYDDVQSWPYDRYDLFCAFHGLTITTGGPDTDGTMPAGHVEMTLDNRDGSLSQYDAMGRLVDWVPGSALDIWAVLDGAPWWLFSGTVTAWRERSDGTVDAEAYDAFTILNREAVEWDPGVYGDTVVARLNAICTTFGYTGPTRFDAGTVTLHSYFTNNTPLAELQTVAASDAGIVFCDADGTLVYRNREWITGRSDQTDIPEFSDNVCDVEHTVWDAVLTTDDDTIVNRATLTNVAQVAVTATSQPSLTRYGPQTIARSGDQWIATADGQAVADHLVTRGADAYLRVEEFALYLHDLRRDLWPVGIDRRLGDVVTWYHEQPTTTGINLVALNVVVDRIVHEITPESWVTTIGTTPTVGNKVALRYDRTPFRYDQNDPRVVYVL